MPAADIKPANVLLKAAPRDPRGWITKLSDFGLAKLMEAGQDGKLSLPRWHKHGTMTHSAPELLAGQHGLDASLDVYA